MGPSQLASPGSERSSSPSQIVGNVVGARPSPPRRPAAPKGSRHTRLESPGIVHDQSRASTGTPRRRPARRPRRHSQEGIPAPSPGGDARLIYQKRPAGQSPGGRMPSPRAAPCGPIGRGLRGSCTGAGDAPEPKTGEECRGMLPRGHQRIAKGSCTDSDDLVAELSPRIAEGHPLRVTDLRLLGSLERERAVMMTEPGGFIVRPILSIRKGQSHERRCPRRFHRVTPSVILNRWFLSFLLFAGEQKLILIGTRLTLLSEIWR